MKRWTFETLHAENEKNALGLQYTIAERERLRLLYKLIGEQANRKNATKIALLSKIILDTTAERMQDIFAFLASGLKDDGFFVEFGACDGIAASNTLALERHFGWTGILGEPSRHWHERLRENRSSQIDKRCVSSRTGDKLTLFESERPGNSSTEKDHAYLGKVINSYEVPTVSLMDLLQEHDAPEYIDFMSIDTEGHEMDVLRNFDFGSYSFGFLCIEQHAQVLPENDVRPLLEAAGYAVVFPREEGRPLPLQVTGFDLFFVPKTHPWATAYAQTWKPRGNPNVDLEPFEDEVTDALHGVVSYSPVDGQLDQRPFGDPATELLERIREDTALIRQLDQRIGNLERVFEGKLIQTEHKIDLLTGSLTETGQTVQVLTDRFTQIDASIRHLNGIIGGTDRLIHEIYLKLCGLIQEMDQAQRASAIVVDRLAHDLHAAETENKETRSLLEQSRQAAQDRNRELNILTELLLGEEQVSTALSNHVEWLLHLRAYTLARSGWWAIMPKNWRIERERKWLRDSRLFDANAYLKLHPDVAASGMDPLTHYLRHGYAEGRVK